MDDFSDDGFDDLNDTVLQELENNAIQYTQAQKQAQSQAAPPPQSSAYEFGFEADDLDDAVVFDESAQQLAGPAVGKSLPPQPPRIAPTITGQPRWQQGGHPGATSAPGHTPSQIGPRAVPPRHLPQALPSPRYPPRPLPQARSIPPPSQFNRPPPQPIPRHAQASQAAGAGNHNDIITALQAQLSALQSELTSSKGEAAILRSKCDKSQISHEAEVARLKKLNAEQLAKQERAVEAAIAAERHATTELEFARQDLKEELGRAKVKRKDGITTPKKNKNWGVADGFDNVEILPSPTKGQGQRRRDTGPFAIPLNERTPTKGKRKRPAMDSPVMALETHSDDAIMVGGGVDASRPDPPKPTTIVNLGPTKLPFDVGYLTPTPGDAVLTSYSSSSWFSITVRSTVSP